MKTHDRAWRFVHPDLDPRGPRPAGLGTTATGQVEMAERDEAVRQAILLLLSTRPGERVMRPDYGCDLSHLAFAPNDATTAGLAAHAVRQALTRFEPRIELLAVDAVSDREGCLDIVLEYRIVASRRSERLVYPYYIDEGVSG
ncbi:MAG: GPW/gp25 family protein [Myxococcales bacterium]|nr:GPW/gp25 family protein [Myxococcales bacterium]